MIDFVEAIRVESTRFLEAIRSVSAESPVPSCPGWDASDLTWHLARVQHFWASIVEDLVDDPERVPALDRPEDGELAELFADQSSRLVVALSERDPRDRCWTWDENGGTVGWVRRRQAHEALIHRVDGELTAGRPLSPCDPGLAADGVDEVLRLMIGAIPGWGSFDPSGQALRIDATDHPATWGVALGRMSGTTPDGEPIEREAASVGVDAVEPITLVAGRAWDLDLWLWGRSGTDELTVSGERSLVARLEALASSATG